MADDSAPPKRCLLVLPSQREDSNVVTALRKAVQKGGFRVSPFVERSLFGGLATEAVARADCIVADVTQPDPTVYFALGTAHALGKPCFLVTQAIGSSEALSRLGVRSAFDLQRDPVILYQPSADGLNELAIRLSTALREYRRFPRRSRFLLGPRTRSLFFVDWERLTREDFENLSFELLTQLGFRRVKWEKDSPEIDISAELPKRDPDGFDYRELWLISLGRNAPQEMLLDMARREPDFFLHRILRRRERFSQLPAQESPESQEVPLTLLFIMYNELHSQSELLTSDDRVASRNSFRIRLWDKHYLTNLIYQFPQIGFKYFSDEARAQSKYRKTPEELYTENAELTKKLTATVAALEDERNKRIRAERDAVWKDISFSAAHKIGNPIFAIETNLDPLERRINEHRTIEAITVISDIRRSVERAKAIIDQFKSLALAQQLKPIPTRLAPLLEEACGSATAKGVMCEINCPANQLVLADPDRLAECFDELTRNALHWLDKPNPQIKITVTPADKSALPNVVDSTCNYVLVHFEDNGTGVPIENKSKIFDAFFTTYVHGTGIGLALVRRIIEGHGGTVTEVGRPGYGADFEIYLPIPKVDEVLHSAREQRQPSAK